MNRLLEGVLGLFGFEFVEEASTPAQPQEEAERPSRRRGARSRSEGRREDPQPQLVSLPGKSPVKLVVVEGTRFDDVQTVAEQMRAGKTVILRLGEAEKNTARRILDFVSGAAYVLEGRVCKVSEDVFLVAPSHALVEAAEEGTRGGEPPIWLVGDREELQEALGR